MKRYAIVLTALLGISGAFQETAARTGEQGEMMVIVLRSVEFHGAVEATIVDSGDASVRGVVRLVDWTVEEGPLIPLSVRVTQGDVDGDGRTGIVELGLTFRDLRQDSLRTATVVPLSGEIDNGWSRVLIAFDQGQTYDGGILVVSAADCCLPG
jgi:hypothetical protein